MTILQPKNAVLFINCPWKRLSLMVIWLGSNYGNIFQCCDWESAYYYDEQK